MFAIVVLKLTINFTACGVKRHIGTLKTDYESFANKNVTVENDRITRLKRT